MQKGAAGIFILVGILVAGLGIAGAWYTKLIQIPGFAPPGCRYQQVQCFKAPCKPILVCGGPVYSIQPVPDSLAPPPINVDETANWKIYSNNDLTFKYPPNWDISGNIITSRSPQVQLVVVLKDNTLMNECMERIQTESKSGFSTIKFSRVTIGEMCATSDSTPREIWVVPDKNAYAPGISYSYSVTESEQAEAVFNKILSTFKFLD